MAITAAS